jgi:hypothetical protein
VQFFVSHKEDGETDEEAYARIMAVAAKQYATWKLTADRIRSLQYKHNNKLYLAEVGRPDPERSGEIVTAIFTCVGDDMCLIGTTHVKRGGTMLTMADRAEMAPVIFVDG